MMYQAGTWYDRLFIYSSGLTHTLTFLLYCRFFLGRSLAVWADHARCVMGGVMGPVIRDGRGCKLYSWVYRNACQVFELYS